MSAPDDLYNKIQKNQNNIEQEKLQKIKQAPPSLHEAHCQRVFDFRRGLLAP